MPGIFLFVIISYFLIVCNKSTQLSLLLFQEGMGQLKVVAGGLQVIGEFITSFIN